MKLERNTNGLKKAAQAKREKAFEDVDKGIRKLLKEGQSINFSRVAEAAGVSKAWLYREPKVKERIETLRDQSKQGKKLPRKISATEASTKALNVTLQERIKKVEAENRDLRKQNETIYGQLVRLRELERQLERTKAENEQLRNRDIRPKSMRIGFSQELESLGVRMNSTLQRLISETPEGIVQVALKALGEAQSIGKVKNPGGFLNKAIRDTWEPNGKLEANDELTLFNEWWPKARQSGEFVASEQVAGTLYVYTRDGRRVEFKKIA